MMKYQLKETVALPLQPPCEKEIVKKWVDSKEPLVSVVCITFNHAPYIRHAINGILNQNTEFPFEIIVRDDASTDGTAQIIKDYLARYRNIIKIFLEKENTYSKGISPQKAVFEKAKGKYIAYCEGDDYWIGDFKLARQVDVMEADSSIAFTYHSAVVIDELGSCIGFKDRQEDMTPNQVVRNPHGIAQVSKMYRNIPNFRDGNFPINGPTGDSTLNVFMARFGRVVYVEDCGVAVYRVHSGGVWSGLNDLDKRHMTTLSMLKMYEIVLDTKNEEWIKAREQELCRYLISYNWIYSMRMLFRVAVGNIYRTCTKLLRKFSR